MTYTDANKSNAAEIGNSTRSHAPHHCIAQRCTRIGLEQSSRSIDGHPHDATEAYYVVPAISPLSLSSDDSDPPMAANARNVTTPGASLVGNVGSAARPPIVVDDGILDIADADLVRLRDTDYAADCWDVDTGKFVKPVPKPSSSGKSDDEIRALVVKLEAARKAAV